MKKLKGKIQSGVLTGVVLAAAIGAGVVAFVLFDASGTKSTLGPEYKYDMPSTKIDPALIIYQETGEPIGTDFKQARAIAINPEGVIFIVGDETIEIHDKNFPVVKRIELAAEPTCVQIDLDGRVVVGLGDHFGFMDTYGNITAEWKKPADNALLTSVAVDKECVYAADAINKMVWRFDRDGNVVGKIGQKDADRNIPGIVVPSPYFDIATYPDGLLRVVNPGRHLIEAYTVGGDREWVWGKTGTDIAGFSGCCNPVALAVLPDGGFVTAEKGLVRVKVYDADGEFVGVVAGPDQLGWVAPLRVCESPEDCASQGFDVAVDKAGRIYVLDTLRNVVRIFEKK
jgi:hypothetical protein